ncbi:hypothetical protein L218DRAFT_966315 [Marasmius fiardii PR-910]|nr:hypothetical protein L218DRAFT_966315 [Marasmius fiardii PR-910]
MADKLTAPVNVEQGGTINGSQVPTPAKKRRPVKPGEKKRVKKKRVAKIIDGELQTEGSQVSLSLKPAEFDRVSVADSSKPSSDTEDKSIAPESAVIGDAEHSVPATPNGVREERAINGQKVGTVPVVSLPSKKKALNGIDTSQAPNLNHERINHGDITGDLASSSLEGPLIKVQSDDRRSSLSSGGETNHNGSMVFADKSPPSRRTTVKENENTTMPEFSQDGANHRNFNPNRTNSTPTESFNRQDNTQRPKEERKNSANSGFGNKMTSNVPFEKPLIEDEDLPNEIKLAPPENVKQNDHTKPTLTEERRNPFYKKWENNRKNSSEAPENKQNPTTPDRAFHNAGTANETADRPPTLQMNGGSDKLNGRTFYSQDNNSRRSSSPKPASTVSNSHERRPQTSRGSGSTDANLNNQDNGSGKSLSHPPVNTTLVPNDRSGTSKDQLYSQDNTSRKSLPHKPVRTLVPPNQEQQVVGDIFRDIDPSILHLGEPSNPKDLDHEALGIRNLVDTNQAEAPSFAKPAPHKARKRAKVVRKPVATEVSESEPTTSDQDQPPVPSKAGVNATSGLGSSEQAKNNPPKDIKGSNLSDRTIGTPRDDGKAQQNDEASKQEAGFTFDEIVLPTFNNVRQSVDGTFKGTAVVDSELPSTKRKDDKHTIEDLESLHPPPLHRKMTAENGRNQAGVVYSEATQQETSGIPLLRFEASPQVSHQPQTFEINQENGTSNGTTAHPKFNASRRSTSSKRGSADPEVNGVQNLVESVEVHKNNNPGPGDPPPKEDVFETQQRSADPSGAERNLAEAPSTTNPSKAPSGVDETHVDVRKDEVRGQESNIPEPPEPPTSKAIAFQLAESEKTWPLKEDNRPDASVKRSFTISSTTDDEPVPHPAEKKEDTSLEAPTTELENDALEKTPIQNCEDADSSPKTITDSPTEYSPNSTDVHTNRDGAGESASTSQGSSSDTNSSDNRSGERRSSEGQKSDTNKTPYGQPESGSRKESNMPNANATSTDRNDGTHSKGCCCIVC